MTRLTPFLMSLLAGPFFLNAGVKNYVETDGMVAVEAEDFVAQAKDSIRRWYVTTPDTVAPDFPDPDGNHASSASGQSYIEIWCKVFPLLLLVILYLHASS